MQSVSIITCEMWNEKTLNEFITQECLAVDIHATINVSNFRFIYFDPIYTKFHIADSNYTFYN